MEISPKVPSFERTPKRFKKPVFFMANPRRVPIASLPFIKQGFRRPHHVLVALLGSLGSGSGSTFLSNQRFLIDPARNTPPSIYLSTLGLWHWAGNHGLASKA